MFGASRKLSLPGKMISLGLGRRPAYELTDSLTPTLYPHLNWRMKIKNKLLVSIWEKTNPDSKLVLQAWTESSKETYISIKGEVNL